VSILGDRFVFASVFAACLGFWALSKHGITECILDQLDGCLGVWLSAGLVPLTMDVLVQDAAVEASLNLYGLGGLAVVWQLAAFCLWFR